MSAAAFSSFSTWICYGRLVKGAIKIMKISVKSDFQISIKEAMLSLSSTKDANIFYIMQNKHALYQDNR